MKLVLLTVLLALVAVFLPTKAQIMIQPCQTDDDCDGGGPCQSAGLCLDDVCVYANFADGTVCDPHDWCYTSGVCLWGECVEQVERDCSMYDGDCSEGVCNSEMERCEPDFFLFGTVCDEEVGPCEHPGVCSGASMYCEYPGFFEDDTPCENGNFCLVGETCQAGQCQGGVGRDCSGAGDTCNSGVCNEEIDQCEALPLAAETPCSTGLPTGLCLDAEICDGQGTCVQHFKEAGALCRQGDGTPCNPDEVCTGESSFCPIDQIDQSPYCRERAFNCIGDDCDHQCHRHHCDDDDHDRPHYYHDDDTSYWWVILIVVLVGIAIIAVLWLLSTNGREYRERRSRRRTESEISQKMSRSNTRQLNQRSGFNLALDQ